MSSKLAHAYACYYYNKGLDRARVRDIYGAIRMLRRSLEMDKNYVNSRNLLGLCLYEVGEVGEAINEWKISKSIDKVNPRADYFLNALKANPGKVSYYRTTVRKCNNGLALMKQDADDLALIQLKRAVSRNPNYVKAWQLLALLYMRNRDYSKARKCLKRTLKTDIANPDSLRYLKAIKGVRERNTELSVTVATPTAEDMDVKEILDGKAKQSITPHYNYEEDKPDYRVFVSLLAGILIGIMDLVPYLHTFALIPTAFLALLKAADTGQNFWIILASAVAIFIIVQIIIDMIITPKIMGKAMGLNPAILLLSLSVWGALLGFIGLIIALPLTTIIIAYYKRYVTKEEDEIPVVPAEENDTLSLPDENFKEENSADLRVES